MQGKIVKLLEQAPLRQTNWQRQDGTATVISTVELKLSDGVNTFYAEVSDQLLS